MNECDEDFIRLSEWILSRLMYFILFIWLLCSGTHAAFGERLIGHDLLGAQSKNFDVKAAVQVLPKRSAIGVLDFTFSSDMAPIATLLSNSKPKFFRVHLLDTVCVRNQNCGSYSVVRGYTINSLNKALISETLPAAIIKFIKDRTLLYKNLDLSTGITHTKFLVSPALEHNLVPKAWRVLADTVKEVWPAVQLVNNGMKGTYVERYKNAWIEDHTDKPRIDADISSLDGTDIFNCNVNTWLRYTLRNKVTLRWTDGYNCRTTGVFIDPRKRPICSDKKEIQKVESLK